MPPPPAVDARSTATRKSISSFVHWGCCGRVVFFTAANTLSFLLKKCILFFDRVSGGAMSDKKPILLSAVTTTGLPTIGQYVGAIRPWLTLQSTHDCYFFLADLHALTIRHDAKAFADRIYQMLALYMACGLDYETHAIYLQSQVSEHAELAWLLSCFTMVGELNRMVQFKEKSAQFAANINAGLLTYPVLMAADILLYDADIVPVGEDQTQHLELARNIAQRFNHYYPNSLKQPNAHVMEHGSRIMALQQPDKKMSKSDAQVNNILFLLDSPDVIVKKIKRAVTDSEATVAYDPAHRPGISNLVSIYAAFSGDAPQQVEQQFVGQGYGTFKQALADRIIATLQPMQAQHAMLMQDKAMLDRVLAQGQVKAQAKASATLKRVKQALGFII